MILAKFHLKILAARISSIGNRDQIIVSAKPVSDYVGSTVMDDK